MLERLEHLESNIASLKQMQQRITPEQIRESKFDEWALRYGLFESIQIVIDIACHIAAKYNLGTSKTYVECMEKLHQYDYIDEALRKNLISMVGLRNMLIHEYVKIDIDRLYDYLSLIDDFSAFITAIKKQF